MKIAIWANTQKKVFWELLPQLMVWLKGRGQEIYLTTRIHNDLAHREEYEYSIIHSANDFSKVDFVLAMGGDGTILSSARAVGSRMTPILGVHLGGLGFLAEVTVEDLYHRLESVIQGDYNLYPRMVLKGEIKDNGVVKTVYALNDLVIERGESFRLVHCSLYMGDRFVTTYNSDGLIVSTPTGTTAYNLSAGGPILIPRLALFTIAPICPHTLSARPLVLPGDQYLTITFPDVAPKEMKLTIDGQVQEAVSSDATVVISRADYDVQMVSFEDRDFFRTLRTKLGLGKQGQN
jgi:NAD+ kinase